VRDALVNRSSPEENCTHVSSWSAGAVNLAGMQVGSVVFHAAVTDAVGTIVRRANSSKVLAFQLQDLAAPSNFCSASSSSLNRRPCSVNNLNFGTATFRESYGAQLASGYHRPGFHLLRNRAALRLAAVMLGHSLPSAFACVIRSSVDMFSLCELPISCGKHIVVAGNPHIKRR
jgi:hypothetical protein